jgi:prepilin-type N-terminal cleavage/methylation domain-containing protein
MTMENGRIVLNKPLIRYQQPQPYALFCQIRKNNVSTYNCRMNAQEILTGDDSSSRGRGFTLVELAIVLTILGALFVFFVPLSSTLLDNQKRENTRQKLKNIEAAMANYVAVNRRLPCAAIATNNDGIEGPRGGGDCTNGQISGVVPWVAIGLAQADIEDGWYRLITYRAAFGLTRDGALDMTSCDPAGTKATDTSGTAPPGGRCWSTCIGPDMSTCTSPQNYLAGKGFDIRDGTSLALIMDRASFTGAAYVLISHGRNGYGAYDNSLIYLNAAATGVAGNIEAFNINGPAVSVANNIPTSANTFREAAYNEGGAATFFDDYLVRPSVFSLIQRAQLGPRSH